MLSVDLTFHGHCPGFRVRCQPSCSGSFAWLGKVLPLARVPLQVCYLAHVGYISTVKGAAQKSQLLGAGSKMVLSTDHVVQKR